MGSMLVRQEPTSGIALRREIALDLDRHGVDADTIYAVNLVATELIGNAIRHGDVAPDELGVDWCVVGGELVSGELVCGEHVLISVSDCNRRPPTCRQVGPDSTTGRGMVIIDSLTSGWGFELTGPGKRVWAKVPLPGRRR